MTIKLNEDNIATIEYINWKGKKSIRKIIPLKINYGSNGI